PTRQGRQVSGPGPKSQVVARGESPPAQRPQPNGPTLNRSSAVAGMPCAVAGFPRRVIWRRSGSQWVGTGAGPYGLNLLIHPTVAVHSELQYVALHFLASI